MSEACSPEPQARRGAADALALSATPTFALMALATAVFDGPAQTMLCAAAHPAFPLGGMIPMYLLMSAFHAGPWLKRLQGGR